MADELALTADVSAYSGLSIPSNLAALTEACEEKASLYRKIHEIGPRYTYAEAKRDRAAINRLVKQVEDERKRVKGAFTMPLVEFEAGVKSALRPLTEVQERQKALIADYEAKARTAKRGRLEAYWESTYPALALCAGEASEPLVPFDRVMANLAGDWLKKTSKVDEGRDQTCTAQMDELADHLAEGARTIAGLNEPEDVRAAALSELYRSFSVTRAIDTAKEEARRIADISRLGEAERTTGVPHVETAPGPARLRAFDGVPVAFVVEVECADRDEMRRAVSAMRAAGLHGKVTEL